MRDLFYKGIVASVIYLIVVNFVVNFLSFCVAKLVGSFISLYIAIIVGHIIMIFLFFRYNNDIEKSKIFEKTLIIYIIPFVLMVLTAIIRKLIRSTYFSFEDFNDDNFMFLEALKGYTYLIFNMIIIIFFTWKYKKNTVEKSNTDANGSVPHGAK